MDKREFYYPSADGEHQIHAIAWLPEGDVKGILQILHGMCEYVDRYDRFACFLAHQGFLVVGNDHLGHGLSIHNNEELGFFHHPHGDEYLIKDVQSLRKQMQEKYPGVPYFMLGHSMGSFLLRNYLFTYSDGLNGAIIMGTGHENTSTLNFALNFTRAMAKVKGWHYRSEMVANMAMGTYNDHIQNPRTPYDWLTCNETIVDLYAKDPLDNFTMTLNGFYTMFNMVNECNKKKRIEKMNKNLPLYIVSGSEDPVGHYGHGPLEVYMDYKAYGIKDIQLKLYPQARHEILNEYSHEMTDADLLYWMEKRLGS